MNCEHYNGNNYCNLYKQYVASAYCGDTCEHNKEINNKIKYPIKYINEECPECGRLRVELWNNGDRICEKCNWNLDRNEYYL